MQSVITVRQANCYQVKIAIQAVLHLCTGSDIKDVNIFYRLTSYLYAILDEV